MRNDRVTYRGQSKRLPRWVPLGFGLRIEPNAGDKALVFNGLRYCWAFLKPDGWHSWDSGAMIEPQPTHALEAVQ